MQKIKYGAPILHTSGYPMEKYGTTMLDRIHIITGWHHLKHETCSEFFEQSVTKMLDHYIYSILSEEKGNQKEQFLPQESILH